MPLRLRIERKAENYALQ